MDDIEGETLVKRDDDDQMFLPSIGQENKHEKGLQLARDIKMLEQQMDEGRPITPLNTAYEPRGLRLK